MPSAARSAATRPALFSAVWMTEAVRSQISTGLGSTQPACGRICSCSSWCLPTSFPEWSKIMNRELVVPWSTAPTKSGMVLLLQSFSPVPAPQDRGWPRGFRSGIDGGVVGRRQEPPDTVLVQPAADQAADDRADDRYVEVQIPVLGLEGALGRADV